MIDHPGWNEVACWQSLYKNVGSLYLFASANWETHKIGDLSKKKCVQGSQHRKTGTSAGDFNRSKLAPSPRRTRSPRRQFLYQEGMEFNQSILYLTRKKMKWTQLETMRFFVYIISKKIETKNVRIQAATGSEWLVWIVAHINHGEKTFDEWKVGMIPSLILLELFATLFDISGLS